MHTVDFSEKRMINEKTMEVKTIKACTFQIEHSLISIHKWEQRHCKHFIGRQDLTELEIRDYIRCMTVTQKVDDLVYLNLSDEELKQIKEYIDRPMTATTFHTKEVGLDIKKKEEKLTSEQIYAAMINLQIPYHFDKWHINSLLTLIRLMKNQQDSADPKKNKLDHKASQAYMNRMNDIRRKQMKSSG